MPTTLTYNYNYPTGANNGKLSSMYDPVSGETVTYTYDSLNRLLTANGTTGWGQQYGFDAFGNLLSKTVTSGSGPSLSQAVNTANNQIVGQSYDNNGNALSTTNGGLTYNLNYDVENRLSAVSHTTVVADYSYDAQNHRVWSWPNTLDSLNNTTNYTVNIYSPSGQKVGAYLLAPATVFNSQAGQTTPYMQVTLTSGDKYFGSRRLGTLDQLGSAVNGSPTQTYFPWGETKGASNPQDTWNFATYWQDSASGLDYANNRYYTSVGGRFMTPDPSKSSGGPSDPQSWNRYAYTRGDPVNRYDPTGLMDSLTCGSGGYEEDEDGVEEECAVWQPDSCLLLIDGQVSPFCGNMQAGQFLQTSSAGITGPFKYSNVGQDQAKMKTINSDMSTLDSRLASDSNCLNWLSTGGNYQGLGLLDGLLPTLTVTEGQISNSNGNLNGIAAEANPYAGVNIFVNAGGAFFYGGVIPSANGATPAIQGNSLNGQLFILIHELAHVNGTAGFVPNDTNSTVNAGNNDQVWQHCQKTIMGN